MKILIVSATAAEIAPLLSFLGEPNEQVDNKFCQYQLEQHEIHLLITGVGMLFTAFFLGRQLALNKYDYAINAGVAGAIDRTLVLGANVQVVNDEVYDFGAEDGQSFLTMDQLGLITPQDEPYTAQGICNKPARWPLIDELPKVHGHTVNRVHGNEESIQKMYERSKAQVETMEGAAFMLACIKMNVPCMQIRSISNYVEVRNKSNWSMKEAIENLNQLLIQFLKSI
ncbi:MAG: futalosine hydrolase [Bacteroidota bacterium]